jgi:hypothetical protein
MISRWKDPQRYKNLIKSSWTERANPHCDVILNSQSLARTVSAIDILLWAAAFVGLISFGPGPYNQCNIHLDLSPMSNAAELIMHAVNALVRAGNFGGVAALRCTLSTRTSFRRMLSRIDGKYRRPQDLWKSDSARNASPPTDVLRVARRIVSKRGSHGEFSDRLGLSRGKACTLARYPVRTPLRERGYWIGQGQRLDH